MAKSDFEAVVIGGGAAGIAAARRLHDSGIDCLIVEARDRLGGRAWTITTGGYPLDLGCGWLHSADRNAWREIAEAQGRTLDRTPPPWARPSKLQGVPLDEQKAFRESLMRFHRAPQEAAAPADDRPASDLLEVGNRWNGLIGAVSTFISGAEPHLVSETDLARYDDTGINWRVEDGYGATVVSHAAAVPRRLGCPVRAIDHSGRRMAIETERGTLTAGAVVVTLSTTALAEGGLSFRPALPDKSAAAAGLPLGLADKLFLSLDGAEDFESDSRIFGRMDRTATGAYHFRPFGRPMIECYFGGALARELEKGGAAAFLAFAAEELTSLLGHGFARRIRPVAHHAWEGDPWARGSYSYAISGHADCRAVLAQAVDGRIFFAGEACSVGDYSTAHGAYSTGIAAADAVVAALRVRPGR